MTTTTDRPTRPMNEAAPPRKTVRPAASADRDRDRDLDRGRDRDEAPPEPPRDEWDDTRPPSPRLPWILAILGLIGTLAFGFAWLGARDGGSAATSSDGSAAEILKAARAFSEDLTNFDGATIDKDFDAITRRSGGEFRSQADQFFSSEVRTQLKAAQASSRGEIRSAFVQTAEADRGTVFVVVDQTIANNASPQPQADTLRMELGLVLRDGQWKVERVSVLTAPSGGTTDGTSGSATGSPVTGGG